GPGRRSRPTAMPPRSSRRWARNAPLALRDPPPPRSPAHVRLGMTEQREPGPHTWRPARFMVIAAHPDDADFGPAATAASWIDQGSTGWLVCCTGGDPGGGGP